METTTKKIVHIPGQFAVNAEYSGYRTGDYELRDRIASKWENSTTGEDSISGNCHGNFYFDVEKQSFIFDDRFLHSEKDKFIPLYRMISPALFLYRIIATFFGSPVCEDNYKMIWHYHLKHKETGKLITFSEWKGAPGFWLPDANFKKLNPQFRDDLIELMNYMVSDKCAHPYDGLVAGSIA